MSSPIDLSQLPPPDVIEPLDFETLLTELKANLLARAPDLDTLTLESEPITKLLEVSAYRELNLRRRINEAALALMLAFAQNADLDHRGADHNVQRLLLDEGDLDAIPPVAPLWESDTDFRRRIQLAFEGFSTAGPSGAYRFHSLSADPNVLDASVASPAAGEVLVTVLSRQGDGSAAIDLLGAVQAALDDDTVRPLTDQVTVQGATIVPYAVEANLTLFEGPDSRVVLDAARTAVQAYMAEHHKLGWDVTRSGLFAALHQEGVQNVELLSPAADIVITDAEAAYGTGHTIAVVGTDE